MGKIYAYKTPEILRHAGWLKIGYTDQDVFKCINQQTGTADVQYEVVWVRDADFTDKEFHAFLEDMGIRRKSGTEWFELSDHESIELFNLFVASRKGDVDAMVTLIEDERARLCGNARTREECNRIHKRLDAQLEKLASCANGSTVVSGYKSTT